METKSQHAAYLEAQVKLAKHLTEKYCTNRKLEADKLNEPVLWAKDPEDAKRLVASFKNDDQVKVDFLSDITAYDNEDREDGEKRFIVVYQLYSTTQHVRIRIKVAVDLNESAVSITDLFSGANWLEREVYDMFGVHFKGHPNLRRIMMDERFVGHPLRKEYPMKQRQPFKDNIPFNLGANALPESAHKLEEK